MTTSGEALRPGTVIDSKYRIDECIDRDGLSTLYKVTHITDPLDLVVRLMKEKFCHNTEVMARFVQEARRAADLKHPHIGAILENGTYASAPYLVMPRLEGASLKVLLEERKRKPLATVRAVEIVQQALMGLGAAHRNGMSHRDLSPKSIFVTQKGGEDSVKLLNFGISEIIESAAVLDSTRPGTIVGTPYYKAPEQVKGTGESDRVDIYALGVILYELLTGQRPFTGKSYNEILFNIMAGPFLAPRRINPEIPLVLEAAILKAMSKDPSLRFSSTAEMSDALSQSEDFEGDERLTARPTDISTGEVPFSPAMEDSWLGGEALSRTAPSLWSRQSSRSKWIVLLVILIVLGTFTVLTVVRLLMESNEPLAVPISPPPTLEIPPGPQMPDTVPPSSKVR